MRLLFSLNPLFFAVISELINYTAARSSGGVAVRMPLIQVLVPQVMSLKGIILENNYKIQTISLVRKCFKLIWFLTIRVQRTRFLGYKIEYIVLEFPILLAAEVARVST